MTKKVIMIFQQKNDKNVATNNEPTKEKTKENLDSENNVDRDWIVALGAHCAAASERKSTPINEFF